MLGLTLIITYCAIIIIYILVLIVIKIRKNRFNPIGLMCLKQSIIKHYNNSQTHTLNSEELAADNTDHTQNTTSHINIDLSAKYTEHDSSPSFKAYNLLEINSPTNSNISASTLPNELLENTQKYNSSTNNDNVLDFDNELNFSEELRKEIEEKSMDVVLNHLTQQGFTARDMSKHNQGYDIYATDPDGVIFYIEVKGKQRKGNILLTKNEVNVAKELGESYWLYVVENALSSTPLIRKIKNPALILDFQAYKINYIFSYKANKEAYKTN